MHMKWVRCGKFIFCCAILVGLSAIGLSGCAHYHAAVTPPSLTYPASVGLVGRAVLIGEQHDAPDHHAQQHRMLAQLLAQNRLAALLLEMADDGVSTAHLLPSATEAQVQAALQWHEAAWPWGNYSKSIMAAVRAGVPVLGANLPRAQMRAVMSDTTWDARVPHAVLQHHSAAIEASHCGHIPDNRIPAMVRIQVARDDRMARAIHHAIIHWGQGAGSLRTPDMDHAEGSALIRSANSAVVLLAGSAHVLRRTGIPLHLMAIDPRLELEVIVLHAENAVAPSMLDASTVIETKALPERDYCAQIPKVNP